MFMPTGKGIMKTVPEMVDGEISGNLRVGSMEKCPIFRQYPKSGQRKMVGRVSSNSGNDGRLPDRKGMMRRSWRGQPESNSGRAW